MGASGSIHKPKSRSATPQSRGSNQSTGEIQAVGASENIPAPHNTDPLSPQASNNKQDRDSATAIEDQVDKQVQRLGSMEPRDIMISYSHQDRDKMRMIRDALENAGISVWVDETGLKAGVEFLNKIGQAIIDAKLFLSLLSTKSATSKYCKDELALAYVSSKPIFPCMIQPSEDVNQVMDFGMRLQLAPLRWFNFTDDGMFKESFQELATNIKAKLRELDERQNKTEEAGKGKKHAVLQRRETRSRLNVHLVKPDLEKTKEDFWEHHFKNETKISIESFMKAFKADSAKELPKIGVTLEWIAPVLRQELDEENSGFIVKDSYEYFCIIDDERQDFWVRLREQALERYTMLQVFSMDSTVRLDAIQNLAKFHTRSVLEAMMDLCTDEDDNVRAVAALSLARVAPAENKRVVRRLLRLLKDRDRLVRQSGCLALGHMKAQQAVPALVQIWRNDAISNVREAAHVALENIGGEKAQEAIHITKVLSSEIKALAQQK